MATREEEVLQEPTLPRVRAYTWRSPLLRRGLAMLACSVVDTDDPILGMPGSLQGLIVQTGFVLLVTGMLLVACARSRCRVKDSLRRISRPWAAASIAVLTLAARTQQEAWFGLTERLL